MNPLFQTAMALALGIAPPSTAAEQTKIIISATAECVLSIDGERMNFPGGGPIKPEVTVFATLDPGEHLFTATCVNSNPWKRVIAVGKEQQVVLINAESSTAKAVSAYPAVGPSPFPFPTQTPYVARKRAAQPTGLTDLEGDWKADFRKKEEYITCDVTFSKVDEVRYKVDWHSNSKYTTECGNSFSDKKWDGQLDKDKLWLAAGFGGLFTKSATGWKGTAMSSGTISYKESQTFPLRFSGGQLAGERGGWILTLTPR